jgi:hypothetical protein
VNWHLHDSYGVGEHPHSETACMVEVDWSHAVDLDGSKQFVFLRMGAPRLKAAGAHWYRSESC